MSQNEKTDQTTEKKSELKDVIQAATQEQISDMKHKYDQNTVKNLLKELDPTLDTILNSPAIPESGEIFEKISSVCNGIKSVIEWRTNRDIQQLALQLLEISNMVRNRKEGALEHIVVLEKIMQNKPGEDFELVRGEITALKLQLTNAAIKP